MTDSDREDLTTWVGRTRDEEDVLGLFPARGMAALLDRDAGSMVDGTPLPAGWHWLYFRPVVAAGSLGPDGHERRGSFLPPVPLERRMWAGGRLRFNQPLVLGESASRRSTIASVVEKEGRSGPLVFVTVKHEVRSERGLAVEEEQDLVYRNAGSRAAAPQGEPPSEAGDWTDAFTAGSVDLFRFSALTFNGHRIHYDHPYATGEEGYPGLVVHGPLIAMLLLDAATRREGVAPGRFDDRAVGPVFAAEEIHLAGRREGSETRLWAATAERGIAMNATADWSASSEA